MTLKEEIEKIVKEAVSEAIVDRYTHWVLNEREIAKEITEEIQLSIRTRLLKAIPKDEFVGWNSKTKYDKGYKDGYGQCFSELKQAIKEMK